MQRHRDPLVASFLDKIRRESVSFDILHTMFIGDGGDDACGKVFDKMLSQEGEVLESPPDYLGLILEARQVGL
jgi:hypothetical protein